MPADKFRIRFRKRGDLRFLSHHDLMRTLERMLRRAALPFRSTSGFHPKPRMVFTLSLPLGVVGLNEVVEVEFTEELAPDEVLSRLKAQAPAGLDLVSIRRVPLNVTGQACRAVYRLPVPLDRLPELSTRCADLLAQSILWVERTHPQPKRVDVRPYLLGLAVTPPSPSAEPGERGEGISPPYLWIDLRVTPTGSARADELAKLVGLGAWLDAGAVLERTELELHDESAAPEQRPADRGQPEVATDGPLSSVLCPLAPGGPEETP